MVSNAKTYLLTLTMLITLLIAISLFAIFQWYRKHLWKYRYKQVINLHTQKAVSEWAKIWAEGYREQLRNEWPEQLDEHIH